jgi:RHS repeat-associated protein
MRAAFFLLTLGGMIYLNSILDKAFSYRDMSRLYIFVFRESFTEQKISFATKDIREEGYMYVWLSYDDDSNNWVYFDDLKVTHTKTNVIQYNEYYPFGLQTSNSRTRAEAKDNRYLYNAANELNKNSGWYEMFYRGYDPALGRMLQVDPYADAFTSLSAYTYGASNPISFNDPSGGILRTHEPEFVAAQIQV